MSLQQVLSTWSSFCSIKSSLFPQVRVPTSPAFHPVHLQPMTEMLPQFPDRSPLPEVADYERMRKLHEQGEKAARANLSFTTERVRGSICHGRPCRLPSSMPETVNNKYCRASRRPEPREIWDREVDLLPTEAMVINKTGSQSCEGRMEISPN